MSKRTVISLSMIILAMAGVASSASAQEKTRAEVRQELIQAENNGLHFVTDTSYPDVNPIYAVQVAHLKQQSSSGSGAETTGSSETGKTATGTVPADPPGCVGPASYCNLYFGS